MKNDLKAYLDAEGVLLAVGGGYPIIGKECLIVEEPSEGLGLVDIVSKKKDTRAKRLVDNVVLKSDLCSTPVVGYEDHVERTYLGQGLNPLGRLISSTGHGNNDADKHEGVLYKNLIGTYLHGPLLAKILSWLITFCKKPVTCALPEELKPLRLLNLILSDPVEQAANTYMLKRLRI